MALINSDVIPASATAYEIEQSLRFNDDDSAYLSWTPSSAGNRKTWTWSGWVKRGNIGAHQRLFACGTSGTTSTYDLLRWDSGNGIVFYTADASTSLLVTTPLYRDSSSWYHIVLSVDTTQSTSSNRLKLYVNGQQVTSFSTANYPTQNTEFSLNNTIGHQLGAGQTTGSITEYLDGYMSEVNFIDGQALDPTYFGETGDYGEWKPKAYTGTYGTNGFYLPFKQDYQVEGFSTVTYTGTGTNNYIGGVGFQPDLVWMKKRLTGTARSHRIVDSVRTAAKYLASDNTNSEDNTSGAFVAFENDGFTVGTTSDAFNGSGSPYVAWNWDMGGSNATNTNGTITSTVRANPTYGQSIVSYTGNGTAGATYGHGLSSAPELIITKSRGTADWLVYDDINGATKYLQLNTNNPSQTGAGAWNNTAPTSSVVTIGFAGTSNASGSNYISYCFHSVSGYSKFGSYTGTGSSGNSVTTGFKPAFLMVKRTDSAQDWQIVDSTRNPVNPVTKRLEPNNSDAELNDTSYNNCDFTDTGFTWKADGGNTNASGGTYIYMAFADTREFAYWLDQSGNNNDWTSNNLTESDVSVDSPTNNFATLNPLKAYIQSGILYPPSLTEGNLQETLTDDKYQVFGTTILPNNQKTYWEVFVKVVGTLRVGIQRTQDINKFNDASYLATGSVDIEGTSGTSGSSISSGDIVGIAVDRTANTIQWYKNGVAQGSAETIADTDWIASCKRYSGSGDNTNIVFNFGQDSSFAGNKTAQGNTDGNNIGDFYYTPPSGYLALCTANLPDPDVIPGEHFNTVLSTGNSGEQTISGVGFQPDFTWSKVRNTADAHILIDSVRSNNVLRSNTTGTEYGNGVNWAFNSDGFYMNGTTGELNYSGYTYVHWNWKANGSGVSNTNGSITSTVSANQDAGFSIVSYTGTGSNATVGHGLSQAPEMIIVKNRNTAEGWIVYTEPTGNTGQLRLDLTNAFYVNSVFWNNTSPTSTIFTVGSDDTVNKSSDNIIAYCFHSVDGFSKVGSYTGNSSSDGTFVYTGFRPAFVIIKRSNDTGDWIIRDTSRDTENVDNTQLFANSSNAEDSPTSYTLDVLSNGFKLRHFSYAMNNTGDTYIYIAFAENPFKHTNAR